MKVLTNFDLSTNQLLNAKIQNLGSDLTPAAGNASIIWYNTASNLMKISNGSTVDNLTNLLESISGVGAISVGAVSGKAQAISIAAATASVPGTIDAASYGKLASSTNSNTASTIVQRDASGNFVAGTITATLTGTASNASQLNGQSAAYYNAAANLTGTLTHTFISDFDTQVRTSRLDQLAAPTTSVSFNNNTLTNLASPVNSSDAATKSYVDASAAGYDTKASVRLATAAALPTNTYSSGVLTASANGALSVDGSAVATADRVLVKNEATAANNGIYVVTNPGAAGAPYVLTRSSDANSNSNTGSGSLNPGSFVFAEVGTVNSATAWEMITTGAITIGSTTITWAQIGAAATYTAGSGLTLSANQFSAVGTTNRISVGSSIDIAATYVGQTSITTVGTITSGTWTGTAIAVANGGTGATTASAARTNLGAIGKFAQTLSTSATSYTVTHSLNTRDVDCIIYDATNFNTVLADVVYTDGNNVTVTFGTAPAANAYRVVVIG